ncbi:CrcB family protein [Isoptericola cucumis]|uniref:fluoride efflux transporter FluC n=1 Tax=Isoptericola cucumis TaxID=1776856 RepID=UPI00320856AC
MAAETRPSHRRWASIGVVVAGGVLGTAGREGVNLAVPDVGELPVAAPVVNIVGAFLLGYLYEAVTRRLPGDPLGPRLRLLLGTGFCGGFTTYSTLAVDTALLLDGARVDLALAYVLATVVIGAVATFSGIVVATRVHARKQSADRSVDRAADLAAERAADRAAERGTER